MVAYKDGTHVLATSPRVRMVGVSKRFGPVVALRSLTLSVHTGEVLVLLGPSGCGKTTALRIVAGLEQPDEGWVEVAGRVVAGPRWVPPEARGVGMVFQEPSLFPHLTVLENVAFGLRTGTRAERVRRAEEALDLVGARNLLDRFPHELSGGEQQRVALARALAPQPSVVLLDEPLSSLDPELRRRTREEVRRLLKAQGTTAIWVTHDQEEAFAVADRIAVLSRGRLWQVGPPEEIYHAPACRFVADFVGEAEFLPGRVLDHAARTELGDFPCNGLPEGTLVEVMVRPADLAMEPHPEGPAVVVGRRFRGPETLYEVRLPSGRVVRCRVSGEGALRPGARVRVWIASARPVVFPAEAADRGPDA